MNNQTFENTDKNEEEVKGFRLLTKKVKTSIHVFRFGGFPAISELVSFKIRKAMHLDATYEAWISRNEKNILKTKSLSYTPLISVIMPVYNVEEDLLRESIESVLSQTYQNWQLCMADDASTWECVKRVLQEYENQEKVKIVYRQENGHISAATNSAIEIADGEFLAFMDCDDLLSPNALYEVAVKLNEDSAYDFIYSDEDKIDEKGGNRHFPSFKPEWSPDTLMSLMYTSHLGVYRKSLVQEVGLLRQGFEGAQDYDLTLRVVEKTDRIGHIPKILYHWRERTGSTSADAMAKPYVLEAQKKAKEEALARRGLKGTIEFVKDAVQFQVNYEPKSTPMISIVIPSKDNFKVYERCIRSIIRKSNYKNIEIITVDNGSDDRGRKKYETFCKENGVKYFYEKEEFNFSKMCNRGAELASGDFLLFLNDDTEVISKYWLERMLGYALLPHAGAVGAKLYYPGGKLIQHCGVVNLKEGPSHILCTGDDRTVYDFARNRMNYNYIAVTGACLMVSRSKFNQVEGFDENLPVAYNDVDFCFKLVEAGYYNIQCNTACLYHYESLSRGDDFIDRKKFRRLKEDREKLFNKHPQFRNGNDCFFSKFISEIKE